MVVKCAYCGEKSQKRLRSLHMFPKSPEQQMCWIENMKLDNFIFNNSMRLCSDHFEEECFQKDGNLVRLKSGSIPTLFSTCKLACAYCKVLRNQNDQNRSFHKNVCVTVQRFPLKDEELLRKWLVGMRMEDFVPSTKSILCSDHFDKSCFFHRGNIRLKSDAVPTIFLHEKRKGKKRSHPPTESTDIEHLTIRVDSTNCENSETADLTANGLIENEIVCLTEDLPQDPQNTVFLTEDTHRDIEETDCLTGDVLEGTQNSNNKSVQCKNISDVIQHDHRYEASPQSLEKKVQMMDEKIKIMKAHLKNKNRQIIRLKKKVTMLKDVASKLRQTRALPESEPACLDSIVDSDVSQFHRFEKNTQKREAQQAGAKKRLSKVL